MPPFAHRAAALLAFGAAAAAQDVLLLNVGCSGVVEVFPNHPYGLTADLSNQRRVVNKAAEEMKERLTCHCPQITDEQFLNRFSPFRVAMNLIRGDREFEEPVDCLDDVGTYTRDLEKFVAGFLGGSQINIPDTCTRETFIGEEGCRLELNTARNMTANLKVAVAECEDAMVPGFAVWCSGEGCETLFQPCSADSCAAGQECAPGLEGFAHVIPNATFYSNMYFGVDFGDIFAHLTRAVDGDVLSDRSMDECADALSALPRNIMQAFGSIVGAGGATQGICVPKEFKGIPQMLGDYYSTWDHMSMIRRDECAPLKPRKDSTYDWRRGQITDYGQSGGGWCDSYEDCAFHDKAGDCESNDDFEYYMGRLYCRYKRKEACKTFEPFCYWDPSHTTGDREADMKRKKSGYHCVFNETTQNDGLDAGEDWLRGKDCNDKAVADRCDAAAEPSVTCEREFCMCQNGEWDAEEKTCELPKRKSKKSLKCPNLHDCYGALLQCYEKSPPDSPFGRTVDACEKHMQCRCKSIAEHYKCNPRNMCGRRCACAYNDIDRFVGPHCDIRLVRGDAATIVYWEDDNEDPPALEWDGMVSARGGKTAAAVIRGTPVPAGLTAKPDGGDDAEALLVTSCDGRVWVYPSSPFGFALHFRGGAEFAGALAEASVEAFRCLFEGVSDNHEVALNQLAEAYLPYLPRMWVCRFFGCDDAGEDAGAAAAARLASLKAAKAAAVEDEDYELAGKLKKDIAAAEKEAGKATDAAAEARDFPFYPKGSLADLWFNVSGDAMPRELNLVDIVKQLQSEWDFNGVMEGFPRGGGWVPYTIYAVSDVLGRAKATLINTLRWLGWGSSSDAWMWNVYAQEYNPNAQERSEIIRNLLIQRQIDVDAWAHNTTWAAVLERKSWLWDGKVAMDGVKAAPSKLSFAAPLPSNSASELLVHFASCPAAPSVAELQIGVSGPLRNAIFGRSHCIPDAADDGKKKRKKKSPKLECPALSKCTEPTTTFSGFRLAELDFSSGFLWGGNFTKGFQGGCPIMSTTINQKDFSTVSPKCLHPSKWRDTVVDMFNDITGAEVPRGATPGFCHVNLQTVLHDVFAEKRGKVEVANARALATKPFTFAEAAGSAKTTATGVHDEL